MKKKEKILVALSGGVDSSVAALLLVKQGYNVTGAFMINYEDGSNCWSKDYYDAVRVAATIGIPIIKLDFTKEYTKHVLDYMYKEYRAGRTPNPDVLCNKFVKFGVWLEKAKELGFDKLATGHYTRLRREDIRLIGGQARNKSQDTKKSKLSIINYQLLTPKDTNKDQTYFLHQLTQQQLAHVLFPLGKYTKPQVRAIAKKHHLAVADKEESMGICFIGEVPMREFLKIKIKTKIGKIVTTDGKVIGKHEGLAFYTIGQRHGFSLSNLDRHIANAPRDDSPLYIVGKNAEKNELVVGYENDPLLYKKEVEVGDVHWISGHIPQFPLECEVRLRHRQSLQSCRVEEDTRNPSAIRLEPSGDCHAGKSQDTIKLIFKKPQRAVTPGQFAVIYKKGECLGGGVIG